MNKHWLLVCCLACLSLSAQQQNSCTVNEDGTVTFRYCGEAKKVSVVGDFYYPDSPKPYNDHDSELKMTKDSNNCFTVTTQALLPETYTYCFKVDGKRRPDPCNNDTAWQMSHIYNVFSVGGTPQADVYLQPELLGKFIRAKWYDKDECNSRRVNIYLPVGYDPTSGRKYPVLYLLHGMNGYEGSWVERGRAMQIIENMIAKGQIEPMVVVCPDCNAGPHEDHPGHHTLFNSIINYPSLIRDHSFELVLEDLVRYVDKHYQVSDRRYIAGLSSGARIAANIINNFPGQFQAIGMFSPVVYKEQLFINPCSLEGGRCVAIHIYMGKDDLFVDNARRFHQKLDETGVPHTYIETAGAHDWRTWRSHLVEFLTRL